MPYAFANQINMYYEIEGSGFPLVLIPGMGSSLDVWAPSFRGALSRKNRILLMDNRGTGRSDAPDIEYSVAMMAQDLSALMDELGIQRAHIMGLSLGAMIAQELILNYPHKVESLMLCSSHCGVKHYIPFPETGDTKDTGDAYEDSIIHRMYPQEFIKKHPDLIKDIIDRETRYEPAAHIFERIYQAARDFDSYDRLYRINVPTLIMSGDQDIMVHPDNSSMLAELIPGARLEILPGGGHGFIEQFPEQVLDIIGDFLKA